MVEPFDHSDFGFVSDFGFDDELFVSLYTGQE